MQEHRRRGRYFSFLQVCLLILLALSLGACCRDDNDCEEGFVCVRKESGLGKECRRAGEGADQANQAAAEGPLNISFIRQGENAVTCNYQGNQYGVCKLSFQQTGEGEFTQKYIYGPFNRQTNDPDCGIVGERRRHPLIFSDRRQVIPDENGRSYYDGETLDQIERCSLEANNCYGFENYAQRNQNIPICRVQITNDALYTRLHLQEGTFVLAAQKEDGTWIQDTFEFRAEDPAIYNVFFSASERAPHLVIAFDYQYAGLVEMDGCEAVNGNAYPPMHEDGYLLQSEGHFEVACPLEVSHTYMATAVGLDPDYWKQTRYELRLDPPAGRRTTWEEHEEGLEGCAEGDEECYVWAITMETRPDENPVTNTRCDSGNPPHCPGRIDLFWSVFREGRVEKKEWLDGRYQVVDIQYIYGIPWVRSVHLYLRDNLAPYAPQGVWHEEAIADPAPYLDILEDGTRVERRIFSNFVRNHQYTDYKLKVIDLNGAEYWSPLPFSLQYPSQFSHSIERSCQAQSTTSYQFRWNGRHIKDIQTINCPRNITISSPPRVNDYNRQNGWIRISLGRREACLQEQNRAARCTVYLYDYELLHTREVNGEPVASPELQAIPIPFQCCP